jgi:hypothetical protein
MAVPQFPITHEQGYLAALVDGLAAVLAELRAIRAILEQPKPKTESEATHEQEPTNSRG